MIHSRIRLSFPGLSLILLVGACSGSVSDVTGSDRVAGSGASGQGAPVSPAGSAAPGAAGAASGGSAGSSTQATAGRAAAGTGAAGVGAAGVGAPPRAAGSGAVAGRGPSGSGGAAAASGGTGGNAGAAAGSGARFSFFVTSYEAIQRLSGSADGFGGDLRFGKADGLSGADEICRQVAERALPGSGAKGWRAFLSATKGSDGKPVNAIDRVGQGPWYDRLGRLVAMNKEDLGLVRPKGDSAITNDLPNEDGVPNHAPDGDEQVDNHDVLTGTGPTGQLYSSDPASTCQDWTSKVGSAGQPRVGHSWPRMGGGGRDQGGGGNRPAGGGGTENWMSALDEAGCAPGASLVEMGPPDPDDPTVGSGGGYGGIYCFALMP